MNQRKIDRLVPIREDVFRTIVKVGFRKAAGPYNVKKSTLDALVMRYPEDYSRARAEQGKEVHRGNRKGRLKAVRDACESVKQTATDPVQGTSADEGQSSTNAAGTGKSAPSKKVLKKGHTGSSQKKAAPTLKPKDGDAVGPTPGPTEKELRIRTLMDKAETAERKLRKNRMEAVYYTAELGFYLLEVRSLAQHGEWESKVRERCLVAPRTAHRYIELAEKLFPDNFLKSATLADLTAEIPSEVAKHVRNNIGGMSVSQLYEKYGITRKPSESKLPKKARFLEFLRSMERNLKGYVQEQTDPAAAEKASGLVARLSECEDVIGEYYLLMGESDTGRKQVEK